MKLRVDPTTLATRYKNATPFPHIVIDGLFPDEELQRVLDDFPRPDSTAWARFNNPQERKLGFHHERTVITESIQRFLWLMNSHLMLDFLEKLTGIDGLIPDPYFGGGGIHQIETGGFLKVHTDFNWHPKLRLDRRLNLLVYLNKDWTEAYGGNLELWDSSMQHCVQSISPIFNRSVVFSTTDFSFHGHPKPLATPPGVTRKSVSLYYYTNGRPESEKSAAHDTLFQKTSDDDW